MNKRKLASLLLVFAILLTTVLSACSSKDAKTEETAAGSSNIETSATVTEEASTESKTAIFESIITYEL